MSESGEGPKIIPPEVPFTQVVKDGSQEVAVTNEDKFREAVTGASVLGKNEDKTNTWPVKTEFASSAPSKPPGTGEIDNVDSSGNRVPVVDRSKITNKS